MIERACFGVDFYCLPDNKRDEIKMDSPDTHTPLTFRVINYPALKMIAEGTPRKSKQSFKHEITLIVQCVNIEIQYMAG